MCNKNIFYALGVIIFLVFFYDLFLSSPVNFPVGVTLGIEEGSSLRATSKMLKEAHVIRSRLAFETFVILFGREKGVISADYYFESKLPVWRVAMRVMKGEHYSAPIVVTIPEGFDSVQIANAFVSRLLNFDKNKFLEEAGGLEGYLFPDTYFFLSTADDKDVLKSMSDNFNKKMGTLRPLIAKSGRTEREIMIMASLIEAEAKGESDSRVISGILWKRLSIGMPLQADAAPETYKAKGLPKNPIGNPGLSAIKSAISPESSSYLYYLHDKKGVIHYARTFAEHNRNIVRYLR